MKCPFGKLTSVMLTFDQINVLACRTSNGSAPRTSLSRLEPTNSLPADAIGISISCFSPMSGVVVFIFSIVAFNRFVMTTELHFDGVRFFDVVIFLEAECSKLVV